MSFLTIMCRKLATLEVYVDKIFTLNTQTTLDMAAQETFNPPWPSLKSLKLGGFVSWPKLTNSSNSMSRSQRAQC